MKEYLCMVTANQRFYSPTTKQYFTHQYSNEVSISALTDSDMLGKCLQPMQLIYWVNHGEKNSTKLG